MAQKTRTELLEEVLGLRDELQNANRARGHLQDNLLALTSEHNTLQVEKANLVEECDELRAIAKAAQQEAGTAKTERRVREQERDTVVNENNSLRDRLHGMTIENARLEGILERVREFDPVSDKQLHAEAVRPIRQTASSISIEEFAAEFKGRGRMGGETWYRRGA